MITFHAFYFSFIFKVLLFVAIRALGVVDEGGLAVRCGDSNGEPLLAATPEPPRRSSPLVSSSWPRRRK